MQATPAKASDEQAAGGRFVSDNGAVASLLEGVARAYLNKDAAAVLDAFAPGATIYSLAPPLQQTGSGRARLESWFATWDGGIRITTQDVAIEVDGALAVAHGLTHLQGRKVGGIEVDLWFRATTVLKKSHGTWLIAQRHESVPFYMDSFKAAIDLKPQ
jgi:ketosteroid isomerase-like protein